MYKDTVAFTDYNGVERTMEVCFNLNKAELQRMQLTTKGGYTEMLQKLIDAQDVPALYTTFENLVQQSYGVKSVDGLQFKKSPQILDDFMATEAYSEFLMKITTDADAAAKFVNGIMPKGLVEQAAKEQSKISQFPVQ